MTTRPFEDTDLDVDLNATIPCVVCLSVKGAQVQEARWRLWWKLRCDHTSKIDFYCNEHRLKLEKKLRKLDNVMKCVKCGKHCTLIRITSL